MKEQCIKFIQEWYIKKGNAFQKEFLKENGAPCSVNKIYSLFGSWNNFLEEANVPTNKTFLVEMPKERLEIELRKKIKISESNCWEWQQSLGASGYGKLFYNHKCHVAHRFYYEFFTKQKIPEGMIIRHMCNNRICVNPEHLKVGTHSENHLDTLNNGYRKIKSEIVESILIEFKSKDFSQWGSKKKFVDEISTRYDLNVNTVNSIIYGKAWQEIYKRIIKNGIHSGKD